MTLLALQDEEILMIGEGVDQLRELAKAQNEVKKGTNFHHLDVH